MTHKSYCIKICTDKLFFNSLTSKKQQKEQNHFILDQTQFILKHTLISVLKVGYIYKQNATLELTTQI